MRDVFYVLCETVEREINTPCFFNRKKEAQKEMKDRFMKARRSDDNGFIDDTTAYCETKNHDNCDWRIFEVSKSLFDASMLSVKNK